MGAETTTICRSANLTKLIETSVTLLQLVLQFPEAFLQGYLLVLQCPHMLLTPGAALWDKGKWGRKHPQQKGNCGKIGCDKTADNIKKNNVIYLRISPLQDRI